MRSTAAAIANNRGDRTIDDANATMTVLMLIARRVWRFATGRLTRSRRARGDQAISAVLKP
jgi:hypothetical protein